jgi:hypothetical protein
VGSWLLVREVLRQQMVWKLNSLGMFSFLGFLLLPACDTLGERQVQWECLFTSSQITCVLCWGQWGQTCWECSLLACLGRSGVVSFHSWLAKKYGASFDPSSGSS